MYVSMSVTYAHTQTHTHTHTNTHTHTHTQHKTKEVAYTRLNVNKHFPVTVEEDEIKYDMWGVCNSGGARNI